MSAEHAACDEFTRLALRACDQQQQQAALALQFPTAPRAMTLLDDHLHTFQTETPDELRRWWEGELSSGGRVKSLQADIDKYTLHLPGLRPDLTGRTQERLVKLKAVAQAIAQGSIPSEMATAAGWFAFKRAQQDQQARQQQQVQQMHTPGLQHRAWPNEPAPSQRGTPYNWLGKVSTRNVQDCLCIR